MEHGAVALTLCDDGFIHVYEIHDDAPADVAVCGSRAKAASQGDDHSSVCDACTEWIAKTWFAHDPGWLARAREAQRLSEN